MTSSDAAHILGRYTAGIVREVYAPYFGSYKTSAYGAFKTSPLLARTTLTKCFAWVGIAEELPLSLSLLRHELPAFFGRLDFTQFEWTPASGPSGSTDPIAASNQSQHPYLRSNALPKDYEIYDGEKRRLLARAKRAGLLAQTASVGGGPSAVFAPGANADPPASAGNAALVDKLRTSLFDN